MVLATEMMDGDLEPYRNALYPLVILDYWTESMEFNAVLINNADAARMMTEHLLDNGHKEVGYLRGSFRIKGFRSRFWAFQTALKREDPFKEGIHSNSRNFSEQRLSGYAGVSENFPEASTAFLRIMI